MDFLDDFSLDFLFPLFIKLNLLLDLFDVFRLILLNFKQKWLYLHRQKLFVLRVFALIHEQRLCDFLHIVLESLEQLPHPKVFIINHYAITHLQRQWLF